VLDRGQQAAGAALEEEPKDHRQRNYSVGVLQQQRDSSNELER